jgi:hypothetical protein
LTFDPISVNSYYHLLPTKTYFHSFSWSISGATKSQHKMSDRMRDARQTVATTEKDAGGNSGEETLSKYGSNADIYLAFHHQCPTAWENVNILRMNIL